MSWTVTWQKSPLIMQHGITLPNCIPHIIEHVMNSDLAEKAPEEKILWLDLSISCNFQQVWFRWQKRPPFLPFYERPSLHCTWRIPMVPILQNPHSDSSYLNIFYRLPTLSTFQNTYICRSTGQRIMVQVEGLQAALPQYKLISLLLL